jgi:hypothetical protein
METSPSARNAYATPKSNWSAAWGPMSLDKVATGRETSGRLASPAFTNPKARAAHLSQGSRRSIGERAGNTAHRK